MNQLARVAVTTCGAFALCGPASAELVGLSVFREEDFGGPPPAGPERWIYRVYADFTQPSDSVSMWGIGGILGTGQVMNITTDGLPGSGFTNIPDNDSGNTAPLFPSTPRDWDTYMTIGVLYGFLGPNAVDGTTVFPGTPTFISNGSTVWTGEFGMAHLQDFSSPQGRGDYWILGNDTNTRVLLMQLVVNAGEHVEGTVGMLWRSGGSGFTTTGLSFSSVPAPSAAAAFLIAAFICSRHRRS